MRTPSFEATRALNSAYAPLFSKQLAVLRAEPRLQAREAPVATRGPVAKDNGSGRRARFRVQG